MPDFAQKRTFALEMHTKSWTYIYEYIQDFSQEDIQEFVDIVRGHKTKVGGAWVFIPGIYPNMPKNARKALSHWSDNAKRLSDPL